jgi:hypothetical protein
VKRSLLFLLALSLVLPMSTAVAAPKPIVVKDMVAINVATAISADTKMLVVGSSIVLLSESNVRAIGADGIELWRQDLTQGVASVATALAVDNTGNIWVAGMSANARVVIPPATPPIPPINPDNVLVDPKVPIRADLTIATIWKISSTGSLLSTFTFDNASALLINSISLNARGFTLGGTKVTETGNSGLIISSDLEGKFTKPIYLGKSDTTIDAVVRTTNSSLYAIGSSTEVLAGKKLAGSRDGIIARYSSTGKLVALIRSSAVKAKREWTSATSTLFLAGSVQTGQKFESALTKFSPNISPTWTFRFASTGPTLASIGPAGSHFAAFTSKSAIRSIPSWKPTKPSALLLTFDRSGAISDARTVDGAPLALGYSRDLGAVLLSSNQTGVSIFRVS